AAVIADEDAGRTGGQLAMHFNVHDDGLIAGQCAGMRGGGVIAQRAEEADLRTGARSGHGLVEALAAGTAGVVAEARRPRLRQLAAAPHVVLVVAADNGDAAAHPLNPPLRPRTATAHPQSSRS